MKIKTFPLQFTEEKLNEVRKAAEKSGKPIYQFIIDCVEKVIKADEGNVK